MSWRLGGMGSMRTRSGGLRLGMGMGGRRREVVLRAVWRGARGWCAGRGSGLRGVLGADCGSGIPGSAGRAVGSVASRADRLLRAALADGEWHVSADVEALGAERGLNGRALRRALAGSRRFEHRRVGFPARGEWRMVVDPDDPDVPDVEGGVPDVEGGLLEGEAGPSRRVLTHESAHQFDVPPAGWRDAGGSWQTERF